MDRKINSDKDNFSLGAVIVALALMCGVLLTSKPAVAQTPQRNDMQKFGSVVVVANRLPMI